ncbi:hypothetical protein SDC9_153910 [bioreactor metagenome]|uniref:Uncharacterized protein n=1 Tax=bioreactor metagenome TaxID=1076179 RepID=A0A645F215_9ZZZZ
MNQPGYQLLTGTGLTLDKYVNLVHGDHPYVLEYLLHAGRPAYQEIVIQLFVSLFFGCNHLQKVTAGLCRVQCFPYRGFEHLGLGRFFQELESSFLYGFDGE